MKNINILNERRYMWIVIDRKVIKEEPRGNILFEKHNKEKLNWIKNKSEIVLE